MQPTTLSSTTATIPCANDIARAVRSSILVPIAALRATLDGLARDHSTTDRARGTLLRAGREVENLQRELRALCDWAVPPELSPTHCSVEEIARSTIACLPAEIRDRTTLELEGAGAFLDVDAAHLTRCLAHLLCECDAERSTLIVDVDVAGASFTIRSEGANTCVEEREGLALWIAHRDLARMGGSVRARIDDAGRRVVDVEVPHAVPRNSA